jgi:hypothetical protein
VCKPDSEHRKYSSTSDEELQFYDCEDGGGGGVGAEGDSNIDGLTTKARTSSTSGNSSRFRRSSVGGGGGGFGSANYGRDSIGGGGSSRGGRAHRKHRASSSSMTAELLRFYSHGRGGGGRDGGGDSSTGGDSGTGSGSGTDTDDPAERNHITNSSNSRRSNGGGGGGGGGSGGGGRRNVMLGFSDDLSSVHVAETTSTRDLAISIVETVFVLAEFSYWQVCLVSSQSSLWKIYITIFLCGEIQICCRCINSMHTN